MTRRRGRWHARWQWRRRVLPGVRLNLSLGGPSVTVGPKWYHRTFGRNRSRTVIDPPGPGYIERVHVHSRRCHHHHWLAIAIMLAVGIGMSMTRFWPAGWVMCGGALLAIAASVQDRR